MKLFRIHVEPTLVYLIQIPRANERLGTVDPRSSGFNE